MNIAQKALLERLECFEFDEPGTELTFAKRLARENSWLLPFAERVIEEYKRFLFLACEADHVVSPSEQVDQAWHLHLTYTQSYWNELCPKVLRKSLHHGPTKGGREEQAKFIDLYQQTLASYERFFREPSPRDIWPAAHQRFGQDLRHVTVNLERNWIVPKPAWLQQLRLQRGGTPLCALAALGLPAFGLPAAAASWNPLNWKGPEFLFFYAVLAGLAALVAWVVRSYGSTSREPVNFRKSLPLGPYEVACLAAGPMRAVQAAFAAMVQAGTLKLEDDQSHVLGIFPITKTKICQGKQPTSDAPPLEKALYEEAALTPTDLSPLLRSGMSCARAIEEDLQRLGLIKERGPTAESVLAGLIMATPLMIGVPKIIVGLSRGRPVEILVIACVLTLLAAIGYLLASSRWTAAGKAVLGSLKEEHADKSAGYYVGAASLPPAELAMALGLFGCGMLAAGPLAKVHALMPLSAGGGGTGSETWSSGGCSSGCGGGGCGGGGCGGCGG